MENNKQMYLLSLQELDELYERSQPLALKRFNNTLTNEELALWLHLVKQESEVLRVINAYYSGEFFF